LNLQFSEKLYGQERPLVRILCLGLVVAVLGLVGACGGESGDRPLRTAELTSPAPSGSTVPNLLHDAGRLFLSWIETTGDGSKRLRLAVHEHGQWSEPQTVAAGDRLLVNWADFPSLAVSTEGRLAAHWLERDARSSFAYDIRFSTADDLAGPWSEPLRPHVHEGAAEHGFVTLVAEANDRIGIVWLDGREMRGARGRTQLRYRAWQDGRFVDERLLDPDVCSCCQTAAVEVEGELLVAYRDHAPSEIRDISLVKRRGDGWSEPWSLNEDGWEIAACPVNGPALASRGSRVAVAWFTAADDEPRVFVAFSDDGGDRFGAALRVDGGEPLGRVDLALAADGSALVSWLERVEGGAEVSLRRVDGQGVVGERFSVAGTDSGRPSGFPRLAGDGEEFHLAWTVPGVASEIRLASVRF
jgi:hypothetical protein